MKLVMTANELRALGEIATVSAKLSVSCSIATGQASTLDIATMTLTDKELLEDVCYDAIAEIESVGGSVTKLSNGEASQDEYVVDIPEYVFVESMRVQNSILKKLRQVIIKSHSFGFKYANNFKDLYVRICGGQFNTTFDIVAKLIGIDSNEFIKGAKEIEEECIKVDGDINKDVIKLKNIFGGRR